MEKAPTSKRGRPLKGDARRERTSFTLPPDQIAWLENQARALGSTKSDTLSRLIDDARYYRANVSELIGSRFPLSKKTVAQFCGRYRVKKLSLFGSILGKDFTPKSDIDILVEFDPGFTPTFFTISEMEREMSKLLGGRKVDIRTPEELSSYFRSDVVRESEILYAA